jgi:uncharacterized membrane protein
VYTLVAKGATGQLADDWSHTALHVASAAAAASAGWVFAGVAAAKVFTCGLLVVYGALGIGGWFVDGLLLDSTFRVPLAAPDNVFHLALAVAGRDGPRRPPCGPA